MIDMAVGALCAFTYSVSPALRSPYGAAIDRAAVLFEEAGVRLVETTGPADIRFEPMPPLMFPREYGGFTVGRGLVYLRIVLRQRDEVPLPGLGNLRTNIVIHEVQHQLGMLHPEVGERVGTGRPVVPAVPEMCEVR